MRRLDIVRQLGPTDVAAVETLIAVAEEADGHRGVDEHRWLDMAQGGRASFAGLVAWEPGHDHPVAYAQVSRGRTWALDLVIDPHHRDDAGTIGPEMLHAALDVVKGEGGGHVHWWVHQPTSSDDDLAAAVGLARGRDLLQLRLALPLDLDALGLTAPALDLRPFEPGRDEEAWLEVNNRAFAWHPEQGGWDLAALAEREREPWFDAAGFLLHEVDGRLAGSCWTKVHADHDPVLGEIYVIAVDPDAQGRGLGRDLVVAGLAHLADQGIRHGMLYVDAGNEAAVALYERLGFHTDHVDRAYVGDVGP